jgi:Sulfotransferase family
VSPVKVLYIGGWGRSGSTLVNCVLGQAPGFMAVGEAREIWQRGCVENRLCGCGEPFRSCRFWMDVGREAFGGWDALDLADVRRLRYSLDRLWVTPLTSALWPPLRVGAARYVGILEHLYAAIHTVSGGCAIVDSSKLPSHAFLLSQVPGIDLRVVHLVRDSRGVAYSWQKAVLRRDGDDDLMRSFGPLGASLRWTLYNGLVHWAARPAANYMFLRYEDFVAAPDENLRRIVAFAGGDVDLVPPVGEGPLDLEVTHTVDGNPMRFERGLAIKPDEEWKARMASRERRLVTAATLPLLARYGYPARSR